MNGSNQGIVKPLRIVNAILLLSVAAIHLFLVFHGVGGTLGVLFILNAVAAIALAVGLCALHGRRLKAAAMLSLLFLIASLLSLLLALTVGLFGITETWTFTLVPETVVIEAIGIVVLAVTVALRPRASQSAG